MDRNGASLSTLMETMMIARPSAQAISN